MYRDKIPEEVLKSRNVSSLVKVLDELQSYKVALINSSLRINNLKTTTNKSWVLKQLEEVGILEATPDIRMAHLIQLLANWDTISALVGSEMCVRVLVQALTYGNTIIALGNALHSVPNVIILNDNLTGYLVNSTNSLPTGLTDSTNDLYVNETIHLTINSYLWYGNNATAAEKSAIDKLLKVILKRIIPFTTNLTLTVSYTGTTDRYIDYLNKYFI